MIEKEINRKYKIIEVVGSNYTYEHILKTEVEVRYNPENDFFIIYPTFYVKVTRKFPYQLYKHILAQHIQDYTGFSIHSGPCKVKQFNE